MDKTIIWDSRALDVVQEMRTKVQALGSHFGYGSPEHVKAASSLANALTNITVAGFGSEARVSRDGDLSLYVIEGGFHYGIIWHRDRAFDGQDVPTPGEWTQHS